MHLFLCKNDGLWFLISCSSYSLLECLTNWLLEVDWENVLSIMCQEKDSELVNTLKCPVGKCIAEIYLLRYFKNVSMSKNL